MNYKNIYNQLIEKRRYETPAGYTELHHIVPRSLGGDESPENLVFLTAKEHYIAHLLLAKFNTCRQTVFAVYMMQCKSNGQDRYYIRNSRMYAWAKKEFRKYISKNQSGTGNSQHGTRWICNIITKENKKISKDSPVPPGWIFGRNRWISLEKELLAKATRADKLAQKEQKRKEEAHKTYKNFIEGEYMSISDFVKRSDYPYSVPNLTTIWKKYVPDYQPVHGKPYKPK